MQLQQDEIKTIINCLSVMLVEAKLDYSHSIDCAVVGINGNLLILDKDKIKKLKNIILKLEGEL